MSHTSALQAQLLSNAASSTKPYPPCAILFYTWWACL
eukprot:CAMPEP_0202911760 /NCGR_PEP_ID=MMETSP1392-20130828/55834_1 /ASSEMBLY_ACC=CAM_ASM_000868 /TAXON_ID=225041 /ORGANISM="Chlamydomonas chlamydogama, Strain SAG 11-48b" /LENGTH=36 /DNA_ID= /DNA_START= /DNA_END= /DNA_ORIENTATION=